MRVNLNTETFVCYVLAITLSMLICFANLHALFPISSEGLHAKTTATIKLRSILCMTGNTQCLQNLLNSCLSLFQIKQRLLIANCLLSTSSSGIGSSTFNQSLPLPLVLDPPT